METEKLWNANYNKVMVANFALFFSFYLITPLLPIYLSETYNSSKDMIGFVLSGYTITALLCRPFSGFLVDSFNRKKVLLVAFFLYSMFFAGYFITGSLLIFAIFRTLHGAPFGAATVANSTMAIDVVPSSRRNEGIGYYGLSNNIATAIAPTVGIFIYKYLHNFQLLFLIAFAFALFGFFITYSIKSPEKVPIKNKKKLSFDRFFLTKGWLFGVNMVFFSFCYGILSNYLAIYGKEKLGITSGTGIYFLILSLGLILSRLQGAKLLKKGRLIHNAAEGIVLSTAGYLLFTFCPNMVGYYGSALLIGLGNGHMYPAFQNMIIGIAQHNERGTANSTLLTSWDLGVGIGIMVGGLMSGLFDYWSAFFVMSVVHVLGMVIFVFFTRGFYAKRAAV